MSSSFHDSRDRLISRMVDLLWHQWSAIGVAGYPRPGDARMIDPEALVLATTRFGRYDSRLMDESIDWLMKFGQRISLQRLRGLDKSWPGVTEPCVLSAIAGTLGSHVAHRKWRILASPPTPLPDPSPLFIVRDETPPPHVRDTDPVFARHGLLREVLALRNMSQPPDPWRHENLIFTLRALLGVNARAEIMAWLLTHESGHPAAIARATGYFSKSIQQILNEMADSGQLASLRIRREKHFSIPRRQEWQLLLDPTTERTATFPQWVDWMPLFSAVTRFVEALGTPGLDESSEAFQSIRLREALVDASPALAQAGRAHTMQATPDLRGTALITALLSDIESLPG